MLYSLDSVCLGDTFTVGPYATDRMTYKSKSLVEYRTPAKSVGLGTGSWLQKGDRPIDGAAILVGPTPDLILLSVRLPPDLTGLTSAIVREVERESAACPCN